MIIALPNVLNPEALLSLQQALQQAHWQCGSQTAGHLAKEQKQNLQLEQHSSQAKQLGEYVVQHLLQHPQFQAATLCKQLYPPMFNCYQQGGHYGNHVDNTIRYHPTTHQAIRCDISITVFLNEPEQYQGGELVIEDTFGQQRVKLKAGDAIIYPSASIHRVEPVTAGQRLACFFWLQSLVRSPEQRRMLFELDQTIQGLHTISAAKEQVLSLSHLYHNLLRQWSDC